MQEEAFIKSIRGSTYKNIRGGTRKKCEEVENARGSIY
jgi:hypothetical protein